MRLVKVFGVLIVLILAGLAGYAYFGDMTSDPADMRVPVELDLGAPVPAALPEPAPGTATPATAAPATGASDGKNDLD